MLVLLIAVLALGIVAVGCGDDDEPSGGDTRDTETRRRRADQGRLPVRLRGRVRRVLRAGHRGRQPGVHPVRRRDGRGREAV